MTTRNRSGDTRSLQYSHLAPSDKQGEHILTGKTNFHYRIQLHQ